MRIFSIHNEIWMNLEVLFHEIINRTCLLERLVFWCELPGKKNSERLPATIQLEQTFPKHVFCFCLGMPEMGESHFMPSQPLKMTDPQRIVTVENAEFTYSICLLDDTSIIM